MRRDVIPDGYRLPIQDQNCLRTIHTGTVAIPGSCGLTNFSGIRLRKRQSGLQSLIYRCEVSSGFKPDSRTLGTCDALLRHGGSIGGYEGADMQNLHGHVALNDRKRPPCLLGLVWRELLDGIALTRGQIVLD